MNVQLDLPINEVNLILGVLAKLPYEQVAPTIDRIRVQVQSQLPPPTPPA